MPPLSPIQTQVGAKVTGDVNSVGIMKPADANNLSAGESCRPPLQIKDNNSTCVDTSVANLEFGTLSGN